VELTTICKCNRNIALLFRSLINFVSCFYSFYESLHINLVTSVKFLYSGDNSVYILGDGFVYILGDGFITTQQRIHYYVK